MPLEQTEPFHHSDRGKRPHALLSNKQLNAKIEEIAEYTDDDDPQASMDLLNELIQEHYNRLAENKIEPSDDSSFTEYEVTNQPVDRDFQDFYRSEDVFEQAWNIAKKNAPADDITDDQRQHGEELGHECIYCDCRFDNGNPPETWDEPDREATLQCEADGGHRCKFCDYRAGELLLQDKEWQDELA
jgi:hypothetical protein